MMNYSFFQQTLQRPVSCSGIGLHSAATVNMTLHPAPEGSGIVFRRTDVPADISLIPARYDLVCDTKLGTTIRNAHGVAVSTIEHLMAALWGCGLDNAVIDLDGPEVPVMDGSSEPFVFMLECTGLRTQAQPRRVLRLRKTIEVRDRDSIIRMTPRPANATDLRLNITIDFPHPAIARQTASYDFEEQSFSDLLCRARTFGFAHEVEMMRKLGLARGGSLENAIVIGEQGILNDGGLRYDDEFVRHKALDHVGDLYLAGGRVIADATMSRPGHGINNQFLRALFADKKAWKWETASAAHRTACEPGKKRGKEKAWTWQTTPQRTGFSRPDFVAG